MVLKLKSFGWRFTKSYKILIVTDAWHPQVNGVVRTLSYLVKELKKQKHEVYLITPQEFITLPCPTYPEIRLSINAYPKIYNRIKEIRTDILNEKEVLLRAGQRLSKNNLIGFFDPEGWGFKKITPSN